MVKIKKISKYSKYFFFLSLATVVSFFAPSGDKFSVRSAQADVPHTLGGGLFCSDWGNPYPDGTCSDDSGDGADGDSE